MLSECRKTGAAWWPHAVTSQQVHTTDGLLVLPHRLHGGSADTTTISLFVVVTDFFCRLSVFFLFTVAVVYFLSSSFSSLLIHYCFGMSDGWLCPT